MAPPDTTKHSRACRSAEYMQLLVKLIDAHTEICDLGKPDKKLVHPECNCWQRSSLHLFQARDSPSVQAEQGAALVVCPQHTYCTGLAHIAILMFVVLLSKLCCNSNRNCGLGMVRKCSGVRRRRAAICI